MAKTIDTVVGWFRGSRRAARIIGQANFQEQTENLTV